MRQGQQNRRGRGRSSTSNSNSNSNNSSNSSNNNNSSSRKPQNPLSRTYESSGPDVKIRGTAAQIAEKYITLARDASSASDVIMTENYLQHAEHYNRIIMAAQAQAQAQLPPQQPAMIQHGHENGHVPGGPQRISQDGNGAMRDQPQPMIQPVLALEEEASSATPEAATEQGQPAQPAPRDPEGGRRRRRRYPTNGAGDRAPVAGEAAPAKGNEIASSDRSTDEALA